MSTYRITIDVKVVNEANLYSAAIEKLRQGGNSDAVIDRLLKDGMGDISLQCCVLHLVDPDALDGCELLGSDAAELQP